MQVVMKTDNANIKVE